jgi:hypothetical protein
MTNSEIIILILIDFILCHVLAWLLGRSIGIRQGEKEIEKWKWKPGR